MKASAQVFIVAWRNTEVMNGFGLSTFPERNAAFVPVIDNVSFFRSRMPVANDNLKWPPPPQHYCYHQMHLSHLSILSPHHLVLDLKPLESLHIENLTALHLL